MLSTAPEMAMTDPSPKPVFDEAIRNIQDTISKEDREAFHHLTDVEALVQDLRSICNSQHQHKALLACARKVALFSRSFAPYFEVVTIITGLRSDCLGWFWGLIRLVFKVGSDYLVFLETTCDMLGILARNLPRYQERKEAYRYLSPAAQSEWLFLLSCVYAEIVQFCLELYGVFSRAPRGARLRHHTTAQWKPLDSRFAKLLRRFEKQRAWISTGLPDEVSLLQFRQEYCEQLHTPAVATREVEAEDMARRVRRIDKVKSWLLGDTTFKHVYHRRSTHVFEGSCNWFLETPEYSSWKTAPFDGRVANDLNCLKADWYRRVLFVQAPPGLGKSSLSVRVIQDLGADSEHLVAFFHFSSEHLRTMDPVDALRALSIQLAHFHRYDRSTVDALSLLRRKASSKGPASLDDVSAVMSLILRQHPTFIVLDGIDECSDQELLLNALSSLCRKCDARIIIFSRAGIMIPLQYQNWASNSPHVMSLSSDLIRPDVERYLTANLEQIVEGGYLGPNVDPSVVTKLVQSSNGSFLWASHLVKYLQSPHLLPSERLLLLNRIDQFAEISSLYRLILTTLDRKTYEERALARDVFCWLSYPINQLTVPQLRSALATTPVRDMMGHHSSENILEQLPAATCGLVDVTDSGVHFTHRSIREYLQSGDCPPSEFNLSSAGLVHGHLAARCLSYLTHGVPKRPLQPPPPLTRSPEPSHIPSSGISVRTGSSADSGYKSNSTTPDTDDVVMEMPEEHQRVETTSTFDGSLPFLRYATLCWPIHLARALSYPWSYPQQITGGQHSLSWLSALSHFLSTRTAVTTWAEASWHYSLPPNLSRLGPLLLNIQLSFPLESTEYRELGEVVIALRELNEALEELRQRHGSAIVAAPGVIWRRELHGIEGGFWASWEE